LGDLFRRLLSRAARAFGEEMTARAVTEKDAPDGLDHVHAGSSAPETVPEITTTIII
jgi:hypothetical protein